MMKIVKNTYCGLFALLISISIEVSATLSFGFHANEGGSQSTSVVEKFEAYMGEQGCLVDVNFKQELFSGELPQKALPSKIHAKGNELVFLTRPSDTYSGLEREYEPLAVIRTYKNHPLTVALLVKSSRGIDRLKSTEGERLSVISKTSYLGWVKTKALYDEREVTIDGNDIYQTEYYEGAITLLLHGDVFVAAIPGPLARRWAKANGLTIVAESETLNIGEVWIKKTLSSDQKRQCRSALTKLERTSRRDKRLNVFPAWVEGFK